MTSTFGALEIPDGGENVKLDSVECLEEKYVKADHEASMRLATKMLSTTVLISLGRYL